VPAAANTEKKLPTDNTTPAHKITSNKQQNSNTDSDNNSNNFDDWSDPIFFASASTNLSKPTANSTNSAVLSSAGVDKINTQAGDSFTSQNVNVFGQHAANGNITNKTDNSVFDNEPKNINGFAPINPDSIFPNANPPSTKLANDGVILPLPPTPPSASPELPLPSVVSPVAPKLQHNSNLVINPSVISEEVSCIGTETVARVGCDVILMCDILPQLRRFGYRLLRDNMSSLTPEQRASVTEDDKNQMLAKCIEMNYQEFLKMQIEGSLVYNDFLMTMPREQIAVYEKRLNEEFDRKDVPAMIKEFRVNGNVELKRFLEEKLGSSLERERMLATRNKIIQMWVARTIQESDVESTYDELNEYYKQHLNEFTTKERVRWKEMVVLYSSFSNKQEAFKKINWLLGEVRRGVNFEGLAKLNSEGLTAPEGGVRNWTKRGDISSKIIENIIFEMPVNQISNIIEAENGLHIVIVTDHEKEKIVPFIDAQASIRKKIKTERLQKKQIEYFENLRQKYHVIILRKDFNINMATPISRPLN
jgi:parvulin-like peptidyl-prolyl isomerase